MVSFTTYLPAGWTRFDLGPGAEDEVDSVLGGLVRRAPLTSQPVVRRLVEESLRPALQNLERSGAFCVLMALDLALPDPVRPVVAFRPLEIPDDTNGLEVAAAFAATDETAELVEIPGLLAVRTQARRDTTEQFLASYAQATAGTETRVLDLPDEQSARLGSVRVNYVVGDPESSVWLTATLTVQHPMDHAGERLAQQAVDLFDAVMGTLRWAA